MTVAMPQVSRSLLIQLQTPARNWVDVGVMTNKLEYTSFRTLDSYWEMSHRPVLGQAFEDKEPSWAPGARVALPSWFSHLLPEGRLRLAVASAAKVNSKREFSLLARLGLDDLPGAVRALRLETPDPTNVATEEDREEPEAGLDPLLKFSLAGAQMKLSVFGSDRGLTLPVQGQAGNYILKLPDSRMNYHSVPEAEFAAMTLAHNSGIPTASVSLIDATSIEGIDSRLGGGGDSLLVERFDRTASGDRIHIEELAQVMWISTSAQDAKYSKANFETIANYAGALGGLEAVCDVIDRIVLNVLIGNGDAHLKNWAFVYDDGVNARLSPAYDIVPTVLFIQGDNLGLNLDGSKSFETVDFSSFQRLGDVSGLGGHEAQERARSAAERVMEAWPDVEELVLREHFEILNSRLSTLRLLR